MHRYWYWLAAACCHSNDASGNIDLKSFTETPVHLYAGSFCYLVTLQCGELLSILAVPFAICVTLKSAVTRIGVHLTCVLLLIVVTESCALLFDVVLKKHPILRKICIVRVRHC